MNGINGTTRQSFDNMPAKAQRGELFDGLAYLTDVFKKHDEKTKKYDRTAIYVKIQCGLIGNDKGKMKCQMLT